MSIAPYAPTLGPRKRGQRQYRSTAVYGTRIRINRTFWAWSLDHATDVARTKHPRASLLTVEPL